MNNDKAKREENFFSKNAYCNTQKNKSWTGWKCEWDKCDCGEETMLRNIGYWHLLKFTNEYNFLIANFLTILFYIILESLFERAEKAKKVTSCFKKNALLSETFFFRLCFAFSLVVSLFHIYLQYNIHLIVKCMCLNYNHRVCFRRLSISSPLYCLFCSNFFILYCSDSLINWNAIS